MPARSANLTAAQVAARLGVSVKALRVWEKAGLLAPGRTPAGWRAYGPADFARIHQILALRSLGLELVRIGQLLGGRADDLDAVLRLQAEHLRRRKRDAETGLTLIGAARARLAAGESLSLDDFSNLIRETTMSEPLSAEEWRSIFEPIWTKHFTPQEIEAARDRKFAGAAALQVDEVQAQGLWDGLIAEAKALMTAGDPASPEAIDLARRWNALARQFTGGDPVMDAKTQAVWREAMADPDKAARLPITPEMFAFVSAAAKAGGA